MAMASEDSQLAKLKVRQIAARRLRDDSPTESPDHVRAVAELRSIDLEVQNRLEEITPKPSLTFTVRPSKDLLPRLQRMASDTDRSEAQLMLESVTAIIDMIEGGNDFVPPIVQRARIWREYLARNPGTKLGGGALTPEANGRIMPSESVRNLSPELIFVPVYDHYHAYIVTDEARRLPDSSLHPVPCEKVGIPFGKSHKAEFGIKLDLGSKEQILGIQPGQKTGDILLLATPDKLNESIRPFDALMLKNPVPKPIYSEQEFLIKTRREFIGVHDKHGPFIGRVNAGSTVSERTNKGAFVYVPAGVGNDSKLTIPLKECHDFAVIVQQLLVPGSAGLDF